MAKKFVIGIDYGTDSVRSVVVDTTDGEIAGTSVFEYPRWKKGLFCDPSINQFRQHPLDYIEGLEQSVKGALSGLPSDIVRILLEFLLIQPDQPLLLLIRKEFLFL